MSTGKEKLIDRIRKLRAKAEDPSVTEAEAAMFAAKVQELLAEHGLAMQDVADEEPETIGQQRHDSGKISPARQVLLRAVCRYYMCKAIGPSPNWIIVGRPTNVMVALDMFDYLVKTTIRLSNDYGRGREASARIDFRRGCMQRLAERLHALVTTEQAKPKQYSGSNPGNLPALFESEHRLVQAYAQANIGGLKSSTTRVKHGDHAMHGRAAAEGVGLHRQVGGGGGRIAIGKR